MATQPGALAIFQEGQNIPAHLAQFFQTEGQNITPRVTVPSLMITGKTWQISIDGQKTPLQTRNQDGDTVPLPIMKVVVLDYNQRRGRSYYQTAYDPNNTSQPICWSHDGITPDDSLPGPYPPGTTVEAGKSFKQSSTCQGCPFSAKGSKVIEGTSKLTTACAEHKLLAVLPDPALGLPANLQKPLRLKIAITSDWDAQSPDQEQAGWMSFSKYVDWLFSRGCPHTGGIVTKMKFDPDAAYPKIFFSSERILEPAEIAIVQGLLHSPDTKKLLGVEWTPAGTEGIPAEQQTLAQPLNGAVAATPAVEVAATPAPAPAAEEGVPGYRMADGEQCTYSQYKQAGWSDQQLISNGKLIAVAVPQTQPSVVVVPPPQSEPAAASPAQAAVIVGEPAPAVVIAPTTTVAPQTGATEPSPAVVVNEQPKTSAPEQPAAPAPVQAPAQASVVVPAPIAQAPEPPAAQEAAASATPAVSTVVPDSVANLLDQWK